MTFFTSLNGQKWKLALLFALGSSVAWAAPLAQPVQTDTATPVAAAVSTGDTNSPSSIAPATNVPAAMQPLPPTPAPDTSPSAQAPIPPVEAPMPTPESVPGWLILGALMTLGSIGGFLLYQSGLTRAKNCGHTATLLLVGTMFGLIGFWAGGFAVQTGGVGDAHAALTEAIPAAGKGALDHELGFMATGHYWGLMGSSGFFLTTDSGAPRGIGALFLSQAALLLITVSAALGAALERCRITAMAIAAFVIGALIYPLLANWVWGGGWLAGLGREFGLGHGFVDLGGAGVVHETAGTLALVFAIVLGPRTDRFGRDKKPKAIPGHNMPFVIFGTVILLVTWMTANAVASEAAMEMSSSAAGLAAVNTLLAASGGLLISFLLAAWQRRRPEPALLCRGLLGGAVASAAGGALIDPWAAFVIGGVAGLVVQGAMIFLERQRIDDPVGAAAVHGAGGAWGLLATGLFANGTAGAGLNGVPDNVRGFFFGGAGHQLAAQAIGVAAGFLVVLILGQASFLLIQKIVGMRVTLADETYGLDFPQTGVLGYQGDVEPEK